MRIIHLTFVEHPHCTYDNMTKKILQGVGLSNTYGSYELLYAICIDNWLSYKTITATPFQAYTGKGPDLKHLLVFGCFVTRQNPGNRKTKLVSIFSLWYIPRLHNHKQKYTISRQFEQSIQTSTSCHV